MRSALIWMALGAVLTVPLGLAAASPLLQWRDPVYIAAGFAGILGMALLLMQPLLATGLVPLPDRRSARRLHRMAGTGVVLAVILHVAGLWITSPPDVIDVLLFRSPTPFSVWGMLAMLALLATALLAGLRRRARLRWRTWRAAHLTLAVVIVAGTVLHAVLIQGTMETVSKAVLSACLVLATATLLWRIRRQEPR